MSSDYAYLTHCVEASFGRALMLIEIQERARRPLVPTNWVPGPFGMHLELPAGFEEVLRAEIQGTVPVIERALTDAELERLVSNTWVRLRDSARGILVD